MQPFEQFHKAHEAAARQTIRMPPTGVPPAQHWWNEHNHPTIAFGPFAFPAEILPYTLAFGFIFWKTYPGVRQQNIPANAQQHQPDSPAAAAHENAAHDRLPPAGAAANLDVRAAQAMAFFHNMLTMRALWMAEVHNPDRKDSIVPDLNTLCLVQAAALLLGGLVFGQPRSGLPCTLTAAGWIVFKYSDYESQLDLALALALAVPCVWKVAGPTGLGGQASGLLLLVLVIDAAIPEKAALRKWKFLGHTELWRIVPLLGTQAVDYMVNVVRSPPRLQRQNWFGYLGYFSEAIKSGLESFGNEMVKIVLSIAMLAFSMLCAGFFNACLSWNHLVFGLPAQSPFVMGMATALGAMLYVVPWALVVYFKRGQRQALVELPIPEILRTESAFFAEPIGWSVTIFTVLHFVLSRIDSSKS